MNINIKGWMCDCIYTNKNNTYIFGVQKYRDKNLGLKSYNELDVVIKSISKNRRKSFLWISKW